MLFSLLLLCFVLPATGVPYEDVPDTVIHPFVRVVQYFMDNCAGTNKSQFMFGALAVLMLTGVLDAIVIEFMVSGHTKMHLDWVFSKSGQAFRSMDIFNHGMLDAMFSTYFSVRSYCCSFLQLFRGGTTQLFDEVKDITKLRSFKIVGDDGKLHEDLEQVRDAGGGSRRLYTASSVDKAVQNLAARSLHGGVIDAALEATNYRGVADGTGLYGTRAEAGIFPGFRTVRLFKRQAEGDGPWEEQVGYQMIKDEAAIKTALATIIPMSEAADDHEYVRDLSSPYGQVASQLEQQYGNWVPVHRVPDCYSVHPTGCSGHCDKSTYVAQLSAADQLRIKNDDDREAAADRS